MYDMKEGERKRGKKGHRVGRLKTTAKNLEMKDKLFFFFTKTKSG